VQGRALKLLEGMPGIVPIPVVALSRFAPSSQMVCGTLALAIPFLAISVSRPVAFQLHVEFIPRVAKVLIIWKNAYARIALSQSMVPTTHS
jgi:hypothetical protein